MGLLCPRTVKSSECPGYWAPVGPESFLVGYTVVWWSSTQSLEAWPLVFLLDCSSSTSSSTSCVFCTTEPIDNLTFSFRLFLAVVIGLPAASPKELHNSNSYAFGHFENSELYGAFLASLAERPRASFRMAQRLCFHSQLPRSCVDCR
jgi:hypothetical protein